MDMDAVLTLCSFLSFAVLLAGWLMAPVRAAAPTTEASPSVPAPTAA